MSPNHRHLTLIAKPLNMILNDAMALKLIDFLSLDVEGVEIVVLKGINHDDFKFKYMCIECRSIEKLTNYSTLNSC